MIYKQNVHIQSSQKIIEHEISPCIKCGCENIKIEEYEDNFGFISTARCTQCKQDVNTNATISSVITKWNDSNNILLVIADRERLIKSAKNEIKSLKQLLIKRKRNQ